MAADRPSLKSRSSASGFSGAIREYIRSAFIGLPFLGSAQMRGCSKGPVLRFPIEPLRIFARTPSPNDGRIYAAQRQENRAPF